MKKFAKIFAVLVSALALTAVWTVSSHAIVYPKKVLVLPFDMNAPKEAAYLGQGVVDMFHSKLAWADKIKLVPKNQAQKAFDKSGGSVDEATARQLASGLGADFVLFGSITVIGDNVNMDATLLSLSGETAPYKLNKQTNLNAVIPTVNEYSRGINVNVFERRGAVEAKAGPGPVPGPSRPMPEGRRHPDYVLTGKEGQNMSPLNPNFIAAPGAEQGEGKFWRSQSFPIAVVGMNVADLDGDGRNEIVYCSNSKVFVGVLTENIFQVVATYEGDTGARFLTLDAADFNRNNRPEIFISAQNNFTAASLVLEYVDGKLVPLLKDQPWYYRVHNTPAGNKLMGQQGGSGELFYGPVKELQYSDGKYAPIRTVNLPDGYNIFNAAIAHLSGPGKEYLAGVNFNDRLMIMGMGGQEIWKSKDVFATGMTYVEAPRGMQTETQLGRDAKEPIRTYIPTRLLVADLDNDGQQEVLVALNEWAGTRLLSGLRSFEEGSVYSLRLANQAMRENWRSRPLPGYLADYQIGDFNNDGRDDLVVAVVMKNTGGGLLDDRSAIVAYELATPEEMKQAEKAREGTLD
jgi:TolB-like protein